MAKQNLIKIGVIGVGHLGRFHVQQLSTIEDVDLELVWDPPWTKDMMSDAAKLELNL